jgi:hypothetical protein
VAEGDPGDSLLVALKRPDHMSGLWIPEQGRPRPGRRAAEQPWVAALSC